MNILQFECPVCENMTMADLDQMDDLPAMMDKVEKAIVSAVYNKNARNGAATARDLPRDTPARAAGPFDDGGGRKSRAGRLPR